MREEREVALRRPWKCADCEGLFIGQHTCEVTGKQYRESADGEVSLADSTGSKIQIVRKRTSGAFRAY